MVEHNENSITEIENTAHCTLVLIINRTTSHTLLSLFHLLLSLELILAIVIFSIFCIPSLNCFLTSDTHPHLFAFYFSISNYTFLLLSSSFLLTPHFPFLFLSLLTSLLPPPSSQGLSLREDRKEWRGNWRETNWLSR